MSSPIVMTQGNLLPSIQEPLKLGGVPVNLTGASVVFRFRPQSGGASREGPCVVVDGLLAIVRYDWQPGDTAAAGVFDAQFIATYPGAKPMSFPNKGYRRLEITAEIPPPAGP